MSSDNSGLHPDTVEILERINKAQQAHANMFLEPELGDANTQAMFAKLLEAIFRYRINKLKDENTEVLDKATSDVVSQAITFAGYQCLCTVNEDSWKFALRDSAEELFKLNTKRSKELAAA